MLIGVPKEIKNHEYRVGLTPAGVEALVKGGHEVRIGKDAGARIGFPDSEYRAAGAQIVADAQAAYDVELVIKIKELQKTEFGFARAGQILFCYHHFAPDPVLLGRPPGQALPAFPAPLHPFRSEPFGALRNEGENPGHSHLGGLAHGFVA